ncbi:MAG: hypothetical protein PVI62_20450 [Desulfobacterales bacterium]
MEGVIVESGFQVSVVSIKEEGRGYGAEVMGQGAEGSHFCSWLLASGFWQDELNQWPVIRYQQPAASGEYL